MAPLESGLALNALVREVAQLRAVLAAIGIASGINSVLDVQIPVSNQALRSTVPRGHAPTASASRQRPPGYPGSCAFSSRNGSSA